MATEEGQVNGDKSEYPPDNHSRRVKIREMVREIVLRENDDYRMEFAVVQGATGCSRWEARQAYFVGVMSKEHYGALYRKYEC